MNWDYTVREHLVTEGPLGIYFLGSLTDLATIPPLPLLVALQDGSANLPGTVSVSPSRLKIDRDIYPWYTMQISIQDAITSDPRTDQSQPQHDQSSRKYRVQINFPSHSTQYIPHSHSLLDEDTQRFPSVVWQGTKYRLLLQ